MRPSKKLNNNNGFCLIAFQQQQRQQRHITTWSVRFVKLCSLPVKLRSAWAKEVWMNANNLVSFCYSFTLHFIDCISFL